MPKKISITITEELSELEKKYRSSTTALKRDRLKMLILLKKGKIMYRKELSQKLARRQNTIGDWIQLYNNKGLSGLLAIKSGGNNTRSISTKVKDFIQEKVTDSSSTITSYIELQALIKEHCKEDLAYGALYTHCRRKLKTKLKVSRKSHYKKDATAEAVFKKTLILLFLKLETV